MENQVTQVNNTASQKDKIHCIWCGKELTAENEKAHLEAHKKEKIYKRTPFFVYLKNTCTDEVKGKAEEGLLKYIEDFLKRNLINFFLTVSIVTSAVAVIATIPSHIEETTLTAQEIRYQQLPQLQEEEPAPEIEEEPIVQEELKITTELMEMLNQLSFRYIDIGNQILSGRASDSELDGILLERAVGSISDFTVTHDYLKNGYGWYDLDYDAIPAKVYSSMFTSPVYMNGDVNQGFDYHSDLSAQLRAEGYHVVEYTLDIFVKEGSPMNGDYQQYEQMADRAHKYLIIMVEVDGQWYVASDYLTERWGV